jgi:transposase InsO family protein
MIAHIAKHTGHSIRLICRTLMLPRSSHHHAARPCARALRDVELGSSISAIFKRHQRRYGYRRIYHQLRAQSIVVSPDRVRRLIREAGLVAIQPRSRVPQTSDGRADAPSPNLLLHQPMPTQPNESWVGDICCMPPHGIHPYGVAFG